MENIPFLICPQEHDRYFSTEILFRSVSSYIASAAAEAGGELFSPSGDTRSPYAEFFERFGEADRVLLFFLPCPAVSAATLAALCAHGAESPHLLVSGGRIAAVCGAPSLVREAELSGFPRIELPEDEAVIVCDPRSLLLAQRTLLDRMICAHMERGVIFTDPASVLLSPDTHIGAGTVVLPNCQFLGSTSVGEGCRIGPNSLLENARIGDRVQVNASQIFDSSVGEMTTVGPFAYIRPGCRIGSHARIGDFVELKNSAIGSGTKVSHLTYIGDSDLGERINVGCGVVTVNYDGKIKQRCTVGDGSFIGCNVNLIAPVRIGSDAYIAAGSTVTDDVPDGALAIARQRQSVKPDWVKKRKESNKL